jgi:hypothetical protein
MPHRAVDKLVRPPLKAWSGLANRLAGCASTLVHGHACLADGVEAGREPGRRATLQHSGMWAGWMAAGLWRRTSETCKH